MSRPRGTNEGRRVGLGGVTLVASGLVVVLALASLLWPRVEVPATAPRLLVYDSSGAGHRVAGVFSRLREAIDGHLAEWSGSGLQLAMATDVSDFKARLASGPEFILAPDGLALLADPEQYLPLVVGRRPAPRNLRPLGVLVYRRGTTEMAAPWRTRPGRTVFGDSVSLAATGVLRVTGRTLWPKGCAYGPDPYDHAPVLHALRLGGFDYAVVRQWDVDRFRASGLLPVKEYGIRDLLAPVPDTVLLVSRRVPAHLRLRCGERLSALGRQPDDETPRQRQLELSLAELNLTGFNLLLEADLEAIRKNFAQDWLPTRN